MANDLSRGRGRYLQVALGPPNPGAARLSKRLPHRSQQLSSSHLPLTDARNPRAFFPSVGLSSVAPNVGLVLGFSQTTRGMIRLRDFNFNPSSHQPRPLVLSRTHAVGSGISSQHPSLDVAVLSLQELLGDTHVPASHWLPREMLDESSHLPRST